MIIGLMSDTHHDKANMIPEVLTKFKEQKVEAILHCGDIETRHLDHQLFGGFPVVCALTEEQASLKEFCFSPPGWRFTKPGDRIVTLPNGLRFYVGHKRSFEFMVGSGAELKKTMDFIRRDYDSVEWIFSGHTHHQIYYKQDPLMQFINPGAIENSFDGYEYAVIDTETKNTTFSRIPRVKPRIESFSIGIISDSQNISDLDPDFWTKLTREFRQHHIKTVIHCGNIALNDVGCKALREFSVFCHLRKDQQPLTIPDNWKIISHDKPVIEINGYQFYVKHDLEVSILDDCEIDMHKLTLKKRADYPEISFILFGSTGYAFLEEGQQVRLINPGDVVRNRNYVILTLPTTEVLFGSISLSQEHS
ncbi:metallophosphoesterase family protein [Planctomycetota bacterium]